jgi:hypothetical protein
MLRLLGTARYYKAILVDKESYLFYPVLDSSGLDGARREGCFAAVQVGLDRDYLPMQFCHRYYRVSSDGRSIDS